MKKFIPFAAALLLTAAAGTLSAQTTPGAAEESAWIETLQNPLPDGADAAALESALHAKAEAIRNLGRFGTDAARPAIEPFLADERLSTAARTALLNLGADAKKTFSDRGAAAEAYHAERKLDASPLPERLTPESRRTELTAAIDSDDAQKRTEALPLFALIERPTTADLFYLWDKLPADQAAAEDSENGSDEISALFGAILLLARRVPTPDEAAEEFGRRLQNSSAAEKRAAVDPLYQLNSPTSLALLVRLTADADDSVVDRATERLGQWPNAGAEPVLLELAKSHPSEKYRVRSFRGWLRLVRQMGGTPDEKLASIRRAEGLPLRKEEKQLLTDAVKQINAERKERTLFNGQSLDGWNGDAEIFRVEDGVIIAGSLDRPNPRNEFLTTAERYRDFTLTLECKIEGEGGNAGVQFRSERIPNHHEMIGYQADMTTDGEYWGRLYDESRRNRFLAETDPALIKSAYRPGEWNEYKIVCWGDRVKIFLNGVLTVDYTEAELPPASGLIGLQIHAGPPSRALYRNIRIEAYPDGETGR